MHIIECLTYHAMPPMWCGSCGRFRPFDAFRDKGGGKQYECAECQRARLRESYRKRKEAGA